MHFAALLNWLILSVSLMVALVRADYIIDDADPIVEHGSEPSVGYPADKAWAEYDNQFLHLDLDDAYNHTLLWASCSTTQLCFLKIPFTGSGITLYGVREIQQNVSIIVDSQKPFWSTSDPNVEGVIHYNYTLYHIDGLMSANHTVTMRIYDYQARGVQSTLFFDYAIVDETAVGLPSNSSSQTNLPSSKYRSHVNVSAIVGGAIAGAVVVSAIALVLFWHHLKRRERTRVMMVIPSTSRRPFDQPNGMDEGDFEKTKDPRRYSGSHLSMARTEAWLKRLTAESAEMPTLSEMPSLPKKTFFIDQVDPPPIEERYNWSKIRPVSYPPVVDGKRLKA